MGIAAYNRGSTLISREISADRRPVEFEIMDNLNALPKFPDAGTPFGPVLLAYSHGGWWVEDGFGYWYKTIHEAMKRWHIQIIGFENGVWIATPTPSTKREHS